MSRALVLGGGGLAGIAWEIGLLAGLRERGVDITDADVVVGTSAGSVVGALIAHGASLPDLHAAQLANGDGLEKPIDIDMERLGLAFLEATSGATSPREVRARIGALALATDTVPEAERREIIAARLPSHEWPRRTLLVTAVDATSGDWVAFNRGSGVGLVDAVSASCAVPGVWPPVTIDGARYVDGGVRSITNADLAEGCDRVLIVAPLLPPAGSPFPGVTEEVQQLERSARVHLVSADEASTAAFGVNPLDPATRPESATAGYRQAAAVADEVRALWSS
ncbi:MAG TPA: patatin-like phospholipase family protein [Pseudonocardiaceae bacterium]|nr:patatin-like phospholipase family protein [Pseudonocardiaceae bacterium]